MAGNQMPVLTLDVNEEHLKRLEAIFEKYRNGLMIGPAGTPLKIPSNTGQGGGARQTTSQETVFTCASSGCVQSWTFKGRKRALCRQRKNSGFAGEQL